MLLCVCFLGLQGEKSTNLRLATSGDKVLENPFRNACNNDV